MSTITKSIRKLEKLSLITCSKEVVQLLERSIDNVAPILSIDTKNVEPLIWQSNLDNQQLNEDVPNPSIDSRGLKTNVNNFFEDYVAIGLTPQK